MSTPSSTAASGSVSGSRQPHDQSELTPRSKVKQLLASLDEDSDEHVSAEVNNVSPAKRFSPTSASPLKQLRGSMEADNESTSDQDSDVPQARRGTLAARMRHINQQKYGHGRHGSMNAYSRVKRSIELEGEDKNAQKDPHTAPGERAAYTEADKDAPRRGSASPDLFVSPGHPSRQTRSTSPSSTLSSGNAKKNTTSEKLQALVDRRRHQATQRAQEQENASASEDSEPMPIRAGPSKPKAGKTRIRAESESDGDDETSRKLTQQARPTRKASKRAVEEMNRETQRMSRNMQLTHEARTKTKFSTADLFAKFNFRQYEEKRSKPATARDPSSSSTNQSSDTDQARTHQDTPPSSPPSLAEESHQQRNKLAQLQVSEPTAARDNLGDESDGSDLPDLKDLYCPKLESSQHKRANPTLIHALPTSADPQAKEEDAPRRASARRLAKPAARLQATVNVDDDLEIVKPRKPSRLSVFDNIPESKARESNAFHTLRALAQLHDREKSRGKNKKLLAPAELQAQLQRRARLQALRERDEKIQRLRDKGIIVQTAEQKEQEQLQLESMLEKARKEAEELAKKEKDAAKREGREDGHINDDEDDYEDDDYEASDEGGLEQLSGSEDEVGEAEGEDEDAGVEDDEDADGIRYGEVDDGAGHGAGSDFIHAEASYGGDEEVSQEEQDLASDQEEVDAMLPMRTRLHRRKIIDSGDEDDEGGRPMQRGQVNRYDQPETPMAKALTKTPKTSTHDAFGFSNKKPAAPLGLSQVFAGTMAEDPTPPATPNGSDESDNRASMTFLRNLPAPELPDYDGAVVADSPLTIVEDSQSKETPGRERALVHFDSQTQRPQTQATELPEPTQDDGFQIGDSQPPLPADSYSTVDTVPIERASSPQSQPTLGKGGMLKRSVMRPIEGSEDENDVPDERTFPDAFDVMRQKRVQSQLKPFDRKQSRAKEMFQEQAEESEDEYAGLGGASDDESQGEVDEETQKMIDDQGNEVTDERDIAAYYADKERREDEKGIEKLYKDVINGGLRRKRGIEADLWDDDDEDEAAARRRGAKQREFAKMRKALLADEKIGKIAENPKQAAFLQAIEDRDDADDNDFLDRPEESFTSAVFHSQHDSQDPPAQPLLSISGNTASSKRSHQQYAAEVSRSQQENMPPPPNPRRTKAAKITRPTTLADIRNTLSEILPEADSVLESQRLESTWPTPSDDGNIERQGRQSEADQDDDTGPQKRSLISPPISPLQSNPRRTNPTAGRNAVINRMALKKRSSTIDRSIDSNQSRLAFQPTAPGSFNSKVPSLLRRATTNNSTGSVDTSAAASAAAGGLGTKDAIKRGGSAKSSVNYYVREMERKAKVEKVEKERMEGRVRVGKMRRDVLAGKGGGRTAGLGGLVGGAFD